MLTVWHEGDDRSRLIGRFVESGGGDEGREEPSYASGIDSILARTERWLRSLPVPAEDASPPEGPTF